MSHCLTVSLTTTSEEDLMDLSETELWEKVALEGLEL